LYPATTVWDAPPGFVDEARGNLLPAPGGVADLTGCGLDPVHPPGLRGKRFMHWLTKTSPELVGADADGDGIPESADAPACAPGQSQRCRDVCPGAFDPEQADADADGAGDACEAACRNGLDDDGDGLADLADPGCTGAGDESEEALARCSNGLDDDDDGLVDFGQDPGCGAPGDDLETSLALACDDGRDSDGDDRVDTADPGCPSGLAPREDPACDDHFDDDGDGLVDFDDPQCTPALVQSEHPRRSCGLGFEVAPALLGLYLWRRARERASPSSVAAATSPRATGPGSGAKVRSNR
ncbi:MAG: hypothetical protein L0227_15695, partial [Chloroflexi bacterium]|nr:hypothetical protein [Chloroflexota bacterium]